MFCTRLPGLRVGMAVAAKTAAMLVKLTRKLADRLDGVDVSAAHEGDVLDLPPREATMLIKEQWAEPARPDEITVRHRGEVGARIA